MKIKARTVNIIIDVDSIPYHVSFINAGEKAPSGIFTYEILNGGVVLHKSKTCGNQSKTSAIRLLKMYLSIKKL